MDQRMSRVLQVGRYQQKLKEKEEKLKKKKMNFFEEIFEEKNDGPF